jgi:hypothetical protein
MLDQTKATCDVCIKCHAQYIGAGWTWYYFNHVGPYCEKCAEKLPSQTTELTPGADALNGTDSNPASEEAE